MKKPTLKDVAKEAGVSLGMASRVLGKYGSYSNETLKKVEEAAKKVNYKRNSVAKSLKLNESHNIGIVITNISSSFWATVTRAVEDTASKSGYHVMIGNTDEDPAKEKQYIEAFCEGNADGLLVSPSQSNHALIKELHRSGMPVIAIDREVSKSRIPSVTIDNFEGSYKAVSHLINKGHKKIAIISGIEGVMTSDLREKGYIQALQDYQIPVKQELIKHGDFRKSKAYEMTQDLLNEKNLPTAIFVSNEVMAMGTYRALQDNNIRIGEDIDLIGFGDADWSTLVRPELSCVHQPIYSMGVMACESLLRMIKQAENSEIHIENVCMKTELIIRGSC